MKLMVLKLRNSFSHLSHILHRSCRLRNEFYYEQVLSAVLNLAESIISLDVEEPIGRQRGSQTNITDVFQTKLSVDVTVLNKSKMAVMCTLCIIRWRVYIFLIWEKYIMLGACDVK